MWHIRMHVFALEDASRHPPPTPTPLVQVLEWIPVPEALQPTDSRVLSDVQRSDLRAALSHFDLPGRGSFDQATVAAVMAACGDTLSPSEIARLCSSSVSMESLIEHVASGKYRGEQDGRQFVLLSLAEAETIRAILHLRQRRPIIEGSTVQIALRCVPANFAVFDASTPSLTSPSVDTPPCQASVASVCLRFFDCTMHYKPADLALLVRALPDTKARRHLFFTSVMDCRRRLAKRVEKTPVAALFSLYDTQISMLRQRGMVHRAREAMNARGLLAQDAFMIFDASKNGYLNRE